MKLSALEIKSQEFKRALRGLDEAEVQSFLDMVASQWQEVQEEARRTEERVRELEQKILHYQKIEEALQEALTSAKASSKATVAEAERRAELVIKEAEVRARALAREAESRVLSLHESTTMIGQRRKEIVARLGAFLRAEIEMLDDYRENSAHDRVPQLPSQMQTPLGGESAIGGEFEGGGLAERSIAVSAATADSDPAGDGRQDDYSAYDRFEDGEAEINSLDGTFEEEHENGSSYDGVADYDQSSDYTDDTEDAEAELAFEDADDTETVDTSEFSGYDVAAELAEERSPVQHQQHQSNDGGFDSSRVVEDESSYLEEGEPGDGELTPEHTEWRIRRILDNLD